MGSPLGSRLCSSLDASIVRRFNTITSNSRSKRQRRTRPLGLTEMFPLPGVPSPLRLQRQGIALRRTPFAVSLLPSWTR